MRTRNRKNIFNVTAQLRRLVKPFRLLPLKSQEAALYSVLRQEYQVILSSPRYDDGRRLTRFGFKVNSQSDEDGILEEIFKRIGTTNRHFVEFGCGNGLENNSHYLLLKGWQGLWIDGREGHVQSIREEFSKLLDSGQLTVKHSFLTRENIDGLISESVTGEIDMLSVDVDGNDFHFLDRIRSIQPRVIVVEYNAKKGRSLDWVMAYNPAHRWDGTDYYGASLKAFEILLHERGYSLVGCSVSGVNAFFVRTDLVDEQRFCPPFVSENHYEPHRRLLRLGISTTYASHYGEWTTAGERRAADRPIA